MIINYKNLNFALINIFLISTLLVPVLLINKIIFFLLLILNLKNINFKNLYNLLLLTLIFLYGFLISYINNVNRELSTQFFITVFTLFLIFPVNKYLKNRFEKIIINSGLVLCLYTLVFFLLFIVLKDSYITGKIGEFFFNISLGSYSIREFFEGGLLSFHIGTVPFLFISYALLLKKIKKKKIDLFNIIFHLFIIIISGSRGLIFITLILPLLLFWNKISLYKQFIFSIFSLLFLTLILVSTTNIAKTNISIFDSKEESNSVKIGHIASFYNQLNFNKIIFGNGLGAYYYSEGSRGLKADTEITLIDYFRYLGIPLGTLLYLLFLFPINKNFNIFFASKIDFLIISLYLINSLTNPTLINSYGLITVIWFWNESLKKNLAIEKNSNNSNLLS